MIDLLMEFDPQGSLTGHHFGVVVGRDVGEALLLGLDSSGVLGFDAVRTDLDQRRPLKLDRPGLGRIRVLRNEDACFNPERTSRAGDRRAMVAGRGGNDPCGALSGVEQQHAIERAPQLERTGLLLVLKLQIHATVSVFTEGQRVFDRRASDVSSNP